MSEEVIPTEDVSTGEYMDIRIRVDLDTHIKLRAIGFVMTGKMWGSLNYSIKKAIDEFIQKYGNTEEVNKVVEILKSRMSTSK